jgi:hypothetical protein
LNDFQIIYTLILVALTYPAWGRQRYPLVCLWVNLVCNLAACLAMDLGALDRDGATVAMLTVDLSTGVALALRPGISQIIAWGYAITGPLYFLNLVAGVAIDATFAIVYVAAITQLGVLAIGSLGSGGGGIRRRAAPVASVVFPRGDEAPTGALVSRDPTGNRV